MERNALYVTVGWMNTDCALVTPTAINHTIDHYEYGIVESTIRRSSKGVETIQ